MKAQNFFPWIVYITIFVTFLCGGAASAFGQVVVERDSLLFTPVEKNAITLRIEERLIPMTASTEGWISNSTAYHFMDEVSFHIVKIPKNIQMNHTGEYSEEAYPKSVHMFGISSQMKKFVAGRDSQPNPTKASKQAKSSGLILEYEGIHLPFITTELSVQKQVGAKPEKGGYYVLDYQKINKETGGTNEVIDPITGIIYRVSFEGGDIDENLPIRATVVVTVGGVIIPKK